MEGREASRRRISGEKVEGKINDLIDRISQLPDEIIRHIIWFLPLKDTVLTRILNKTWARASPGLILNKRSFVKRTTDGNLFQKSLLDVEKEINQSFQSYRNQGLSTRTLFLFMPHRFEYARSIKNRIEFIVNSNIFHVMHICFSIDWLEYNFPSTVYASRNLTVLSLSNCSLKNLSINEPATLYSLRELSLENVLFSKEGLEFLIPLCPNIVKLVLKRCNNIVKLHLHGLDRLEKLEISGVRSWIQLIYLPSLRTFIFHDHSDKPGYMSLSGCTNLETLWLNTSFLPKMSGQYSFPKNFFLKFPRLKSLFLCGLFESEGVMISSSILFLYGLKHCEAFLCSMADKCLQKIKIEFHKSCPNDISWFQKFSSFIKNVKLDGVLSLHFHGEVSLNLQKLGAIRDHTVGNLKLVKVKGLEDLSSCTPLINALLCRARPETISIKLTGDPSRCIEAIRNYLQYKKGDSEKYCCDSHFDKCWRHYLKNVVIEPTRAQDEKKEDIFQKCSKINIRFQWH